MAKSDLNTASREEIMQAPDFGEEMADRVIQNRPYRSWEDVDRLFQVGDKRVDFLRENFTLGGEEGRRKAA